MKLKFLLICFALLTACSPNGTKEHPSEDRKATETSTGNSNLPEQAVEALGLRTRSVSNGSTARQLGLPLVIRGALVTSVIPRTPAARAGLDRNDVITEIRVGKGANQLGYSIASSADLAGVLTQLSDRTHLTVEVFRGPAPLNRSSYATHLFEVRLEHI